VVGPPGTVEEPVPVVVVDETWSLKAPPGTEKEVVALAGTLPVELRVDVSVAVELEVLSVGSQSSPSSPVGVADVVLAVLELEVVEAVFDEGPVGTDVVEAVPVVEEEVPVEESDWNGMVESED
jgi:hypothetical protein